MVNHKKCTNKQNPNHSEWPMVRWSVLSTHNWNPPPPQRMTFFMVQQTTWEIIRFNSFNVKKKKLVIIWKWDCFCESLTLIYTISFHGIFWMAKQKTKSFTFLCCCFCFVADNTICYDWKSQQSCNNLNQNLINLHHNPTQQTTMTMNFHRQNIQDNITNNNNNIWVSLTT